MNLKYTWEVLFITVTVCSAKEENLCIWSLLHGYLEFRASPRNRDTDGKLLLNHLVLDCIPSTLPISVSSNLATLSVLAQSFSVFQPEPRKYGKGFNWFDYLRGSLMSLLGQGLQVRLPLTVSFVISAGSPLGMRRQDDFCYRTPWCKCPGSLTPSPNHL